MREDDLRASNNVEDRRGSGMGGVRAGGLGIGLTLVKNLVELHEGAIEARSAGVGKGSEFLIRLPVLAQSPNLPQSKPANGEADRGRKSREMKVRHEAG